MNYVLAIDQGTTSSRAILFDNNMEPAFISQKEFPQYFPNSGWVEHDPTEIWESVLYVCRDVIKKSGIKSSQIVSIGITNQRETTLIWDKNTGETVHNAIVWQDRRTSTICSTLKDKGYESRISQITGLLLDPYFSATKVKWLLDNNEKVRNGASEGNYYFGTVDTFLIWKFTGGRVHATDATNASRTMLYDIEKCQWSEEICSMFDIPHEILPKVLNCADDFGETDSSFFGHKIPITGVAGDQHAATIGQACFKPGMIKATYGTGCFIMLNTGNTRINSENRLLTTIAYRLDGLTTYAIEGSIFVAGASVQWLRDGLKIITSPSQTEELASTSDLKEKIYFVPAFTGLGAPHWDSQCRGAIFGLTRNTGAPEICRAALESVGYQTKDLLNAMTADKAIFGDAIMRIDGGMSASNWTMQFISDIIGAPVDRPKILETTALGVAWLAGMRIGFYPSQREFSDNWAKEKRFEANIGSEERAMLYGGWKSCVQKTLLK